MGEIIRAAIAVLLCIGVLSTFDADAKTFTRKEIGESRYKLDEHARLLKLAYTVKDKLNEEIFGQEAAIAFVQNQLVQYFESFLDRKNEPQAVNLAGLSGIGKSAIVNKLREMGFPIVHFDAQKYSHDQYDSFSYDVARRLRDYVQNKKPVILVVEEIDKVPEIGRSDDEKSNTLIGALNQILSAGKLSTGYETMDVSNVMVITDMNISPEFIEAFSRDVLKKEKSYFDYTHEDIMRLDEWLKMDPSSTYKILSKTFRSNTVGRLAPITSVMSPLNSEAYRRIAEQMVQGAITTITGGDKNAAKWISVTYDEAFVDFLMRKSTYAPSGARETVARSRLLAEQLINFAMKAEDPAGTEMDRPRHVHLSIAAESEDAVLKITPRKRSGGELVDLEPFSFRLPYDRAMKMFDIPTEHVVVEAPKFPKTEAKEKRVSQKTIVSARYPKAAKSDGRVGRYLNQHVLGQEIAVAAIEEDVQRFRGQIGNVVTSPIYRILAGFPGIGKSELMKRLGEALQIPVIKVNMQRYASAGDDAVKNFMKDVSRAIQARSGEADGKFILLIEEMDKLFEIHPQTGIVQNRPVMAVLKDLMNDGVVSLRDDSNTMTLDVRGQLTYFTMNFSVDRFNFSADPRLTSIEDVLGAWKKMSGTAMAVKDVLGSIFTPDTISRMMPRFVILKPLEKRDYERIIVQQIDEVLRARFHRADGVNAGQVELSLSDEYKAYLAAETVIPSEGARNTAVSARALISAHLERTLNEIQRGSAFARQPIHVRLHYRPGRREVVGQVRLQGDKKGSELEVMNEKVALTFPSTENRGRLTPERVLVAAHEFGHAFASVRLGMRLEHVVVTSPKPGIGGYVKYKANAFSAHEYISSIYSTLAARAFERIVLSDNPLDPESTLETTAGASSDIQHATIDLYNLIYELGLDPNGGIVDRNFIKGPGKYAAYQELPPEKAEALSMILRDLENTILRDFLDAHSLDWYVEKIAVLAHKGAMVESEFYELTGYTFPGEGKARASVYDNERMRKLFGKHLISQPADQRRVRVERDDTVKALVGRFSDIIKRRLHSNCEDLLSSGS